jgi:hypothetical protein
MTPRQPADGQPTAAQRTVRLDGLECVRRTRRVITAHLPVQRAHHQPVALEEQDENGLHRTLSAATTRGRPVTTSRADRRSSASWSPDTFADDGNARTTARVPRGRSSRCWPTRWRRRRRTSLRTVALPTARLTTNPTRGGSSRSMTTRWTTSVGRPARRPRRTAVANSAERRIRLGAGSTTSISTWAYPSRSDSEPLATLAPAGGDDGAAGAGPHPQPESVRLVTAPVVGLECALHWRVSRSDMRVRGHRRLDVTVHPRPHRPRSGPQGTSASGPPVERGTTTVREHTAIAERTAS